MSEPIVEKFLDTYTCQECGVVEAYEKAYEVGGIASSKLVCRLCAKKEEEEEFSVVVRVEHPQES